MTWEGDYDLWIEKYSFWGPYESRRGNGAYRHVFNNVDFMSVFQLHTHPSGRITVQDVSASLRFESCEVFSENYTINSRPISDWAEVSRAWKVNFDYKMETEIAVVEEAIEFVYGSLFGLARLPYDGVVDFFRNYGAEIIEANP